MNDTLIENYDKLIKKIASSFYNASYEDLYQVGYIGLLKALRNYKNNKNAKFSSYAYSWIYGEMYDFVNNDRPIKISSNYLKLYKKIIKTRDILTQKNGKVPNNSEIAFALDINEDLISETLLSVEKVLSIEANEEFNLLDKVTKKEEPIENKILIKDSLKHLEDIEKDIIKYRYFEDKTQSETAKALNMSQVKVSRYEQKSLKKLKKYIYS